ncbi:siphovirus ReqiPepy6 Gp37-like family protein [Streptomyces rimosus]|uniref:siphovirus ReqiPepy6 Gp37-like family protein n=1 Tax=Streptomyces rimosus TaxID=1927 RepID=UPI0004C1F34E|nr:siphovirus ReqiPepy6 Gp37-like family protein [Streptomyces rimosus]
MGDYRIIVRNQQLVPVGQIDDYIEFNAVLKFCDTGQWTLKIQADRANTRLLQPGCGILVYREGVARPILSGPVHGIQKYWTVDTDSGPGALFITGADDNHIVASHVVYPDPRNAVDQQSRASDAASDREASYGLETLIDFNAGTHARTGRRPSGYVTPDGVTVPYSKWGPKTPFSYRFENLRDAVRPLAEAGGIGWRNIYDPESRSIRLETFRVEDRTGTVRFSPDLGNLKQYVYSLTAPKVTRAIVAAQGEGKDRFIKEYVDKDAEAFWSIVAEQFVDARDIPLKRGKDGKPTLAAEVEAGTTVQTALATMDQRGQAALAEGQQSGNMQVYPIDTPSCTFGLHWWLGDKVTCVVDGEVHQDIVRQVTISDSAEGSTITPNIGNQGTDTPTNVFGEIRRLWAKVNQLSTRM